MGFEDVWLRQLVCMVCGSFGAVYRVCVCLCVFSLMEGTDIITTLRLMTENVLKFMQYSVIKWWFFFFADEKLRKNTPPSQTTRTHYKRERTTSARWQQSEMVFQQRRLARRVAALPRKHARAMASRQAQDEGAQAAAGGWGKWRRHDVTAREPRTGSGCKTLTSFS